MRVIPLWLRVLAGLLAAAAGLALVLLLRDSAGQVTDLAGFIGQAARAILFLGFGILFAYVALTGLPPEHWWRGAGETLGVGGREAALPPDMHRYLATLRARHPGIGECWLLQAAARDECRLLVRAREPVLEGLRGDWDIRRKDVRLHLLVPGSSTVTPAWGRPDPLDFASWDWEPQSEDLAEYRCPFSGEVRVAQRLWSGNGEVLKSGG